MPTLQDFETALNEVVQAKRLSQSKMTKLTEIAMELMDRDTQLVSTMYRTHKSLPVPCKVSSLYVFDALARAARQQVIKHDLSERHSTGNCATFLLKVAGVLEGLFQDMLAAGVPEMKEKTKKIYDIWMKGGTFPPNILGRLSDIVSGKDKEPDVNPPITIDPRVTPQIITATPAQNAIAPAPPDPQVALLALLTQAANQQIPQTTPNTVVAPTTPVDAPHLALLQYLQTAAANNATTSQIPLTTSPQVSDTHVSQTATDPRITKSPLATHTEPVHARQRERRDSYRSPPRSDPYHKRDHDDQTHPHKDHRDNFRRRGRWNRWDESSRDYRRNSTEVERSPSRDGRSRSRSPENRGRRKISPPTSPPRRQTFPVRARYDDSGTKGYTTTRGPGKDEFGRDLRSSSPSSAPGNHSPATPSTPHDPKAELSSMSTSNDPMSRSSSVAVNTSSKEPDASVTPLESNTKAILQAGLDKFNLSAFDPTSPASWEALGKLWEATNGYTPSTEELMQFVMMGVMTQPANSKNWEQTDVASPNGLNNYGGGRGVTSRGRGGYGGLYGNNRTNHSGRTHGREEMDNQATDAIVLGGGTDVDVSMTESPSSQQRSPDPGVRSGGRMQKVGDRWVFVRDDNSS